MLIGDRWVEAVIGHIAGGDVVEDPPLPKKVIEERCTENTARVLERRGASSTTCSSEPRKSRRGPAVAELARSAASASKPRGNEDALAKLREFMANLKKPRRVEEPEIPPAAPPGRPRSTPRSQ